MKKPTFIRLLLLIITFNVTYGFCQDVPIIHKTLYVPLSKTYICKGDSATAEINGYLINPQGTSLTVAPFNLLEKDITFIDPECRDTTIITKYVQPRLEGFGGKITHITYNDWSGGNCEPLPDRNGKLEITLKPTVTTHYRLYWQVRNVSNINKTICQCAAFPIWIESYYAEFDVVVVDPEPPKLLTKDTGINLNSSFYVSANATFETASQQITWYETVCDTLQSFTMPIFGYSDPNPITQGFAASTIGKREIKAKIADNGCLSDFSDPVNIYVKPCRNFTNYCDQTLENYVEHNSCYDNASSRDDYHFYHLERELCTNCDVEKIWEKYKASIDHQAIILSDQTAFLGRVFGNSSNIGFSRLLFPEGTYDEPITDCKRVLLPRITRYMFDISYFFDLAPVSGAIALVSSLCAEKPSSYSDPIMIRVDEASKCVTNYTLPGHVLYPGKVTRCLVKECDKVKLFTFGEGTTEYPNTVCGLFLKVLNKIWGESMFTNVDERTFMDLAFRAPSMLVGGKPLNTDFLSISNKNWQVKSLRVKYPESDSMYTFFMFNDTVNFHNLKQLNIYFADDGHFDGIDVDGNYNEGNWTYDSVKKQLIVDSSFVEIVWQTTDEFRAKFVIPVFKDTTVSSAECYFTFHNKNFEGKSYTFTGNGNWDDPTMWVDGQVPPLIIPYGTTVHINPTKADARCILNGSLVVNKGGKLVVETNKSLVVYGGITFK